MTTSLHLLRHLQVLGTLRNRTNLRVGGSEPGLAIGDVDNPVIRDPVTHDPYIPGSSLKGKLRSLLEYKYRADQIANGQPCGCAGPDCPVCRLFGPHLQGPRARQGHGLGPTRLLVRDAFMTDQSRARLRTALADLGWEYTALKTENSIDRRTGRAQNPRDQEIVPPGCTFDLNISVRVFEGDNEDNFKAWISEALDLLPKEAIGAGGSRGYGWVDVEYRIEDEA